MQWACEHCGEKYQDFAAAEACENSCASRRVPVCCWCHQRLLMCTLGCRAAPAVPEPEPAMAPASAPPTAPTEEEEVTDKEDSATDADGTDEEADDEQPIPPCEWTEHWNAKLGK